MVSARAFAFAIPLALAGASCQILLGIDTNVAILDGGVAEAGLDSGLDSALDSGDDSGDGNAESGPPCTAGSAGAALVPVGDAGYCIDRTEVTVADYRAFFAVRGGNPVGQRIDCMGNTTFLPSSGLPPASEDKLPIHYIDFCDALAFCDWAGKRLCGSVNGQPMHVDAGNDPHVSQWYRACSHNNEGLHNYPYGETFDQTRCNAYVPDGGGGLPRYRKDVGVYPGCEGGYPGIFDMAGNVDEWEDACDPTDGGPPVCAYRGGNWNNGYAAASACYSVKVQPMTMASDTLGFRCCSR